MLRAFTEAERAALVRGGVDVETGATLVGTHFRADEAKYRALLEGSLTVDQAARRLGVHPSRVRQRLGARSLYGIRLGPTWHIPSFQFAGKRLVPGADVVFRRMDRDLSPLAVLRWFTSPNPDLFDGEDEDPMTPLQRLRTGHPPERAAALAADL